MMKVDIWRLQTDCNKDLVIRTELNYFNTYFLGEKMKDNWSPPEIRLLGKSKRLRDFVSWMLQAPVISEKAKNALEQLIGAYVEFLPLIELRNRLYYAVNVIKLVDCLDRDRSEMAYHSDDPSSIRAIHRTFFVENRLESIPIFKIPDWPSDVFVTRPFVDAVIQNNLRGATFADPSVDSLKKILRGEPLNVVEGVPE